MDSDPVLPSAVTLPLHIIFPLPSLAMVMEALPNQKGWLALVRLECPQGPKRGRLAIVVVSVRNVQAQLVRITKPCGQDTRRTESNTVLVTERSRKPSLPELVSHGKLFQTRFLRDLAESLVQGFLWVQSSPFGIRGELLGLSLSHYCA